MGEDIRLELKTSKLMRGVIRKKDMDVRWVKEKNKYYFEYKNHIKADIRSKFITHYEIISKEVHDKDT